MIWWILALIIALFLLSIFVVGLVGYAQWLIGRREHRRWLANEERKEKEYRQVRAENWDETAGTKK